MIRPTRIAAIAIALLTGPVLAAAALQVTNVQADRVIFDPAQGETVSVRFRLSEEARVVLRIYDGRELPIRDVASDGPLAAGEHALAWDGGDVLGRPVPPEAYHYTLTATTAAGEGVEHDLTDLTGGENLVAEEVAWDPASKGLHYLITELARVNIRIGLEAEGPLLRTLIDWVPRGSGIRKEAWDGKDASGVLDLSDHPKLRILVNAFSLPDNTILVGPEPAEVTLIEDVSWPVTKREVKSTSWRRPRTFAAQSLGSRKDIALELRLPEDLSRTAEGLPIVTGPVPVRMHVPESEDRTRILAERFETAFYLDGLYEFENEVGFLPATWVWDPSGANQGVHYLTGNLLGYEGHFGIATVKVYVQAGAME